MIDHAAQDAPIPRKVRRLKVIRPFEVAFVPAGANGEPEFLVCKEAPMLTVENVVKALDCLQEIRKSLESVGDGAAVGTGTVPVLLHKSFIDAVAPLLAGTDGGVVNMVQELKALHADLGTVTHSCSDIGVIDALDNLTSRAGSLLQMAETAKAAAQTPPPPPPPGGKKPEAGEDEEAKKACAEKACAEKVEKDEGAAASAVATPAEGSAAPAPAAPIADASAAAPTAPVVEAAVAPAPASSEAPAAPLAPASVVVPTDASSAAPVISAGPQPVAAPPVDIGAPGAATDFMATFKAAMAELLAPVSAHIDSSIAAVKAEFDTKLVEVNKAAQVAAAVAAVPKPAEPGKPGSAVQATAPVETPTTRQPLDWPEDFNEGRPLPDDVICD